MNLEDTTHSGFTDPSHTSASPCELIDGQPVDWSGRGTSHVDYSKNDVIPLTRGRYLGHGVNGPVYETTYNGIRLAWKQKFSRRKIGDPERREIEIIKKLSHKHVIRLIGTYAQDRCLGLLLWPVAVCDLSNLLEDYDCFMTTHDPTIDAMPVDSESSDYSLKNERQARLESLLGFRYPDPSRTMFDTINYLRRSIVCIANAVGYLHDSGIKHKDLKPSNILLSKKGLWITDFGTATDFSILSSSATDNGERGTPKYFAPEVAAYTPSGRAADVFSMGCIFFEIITLCMGHPLSKTKALREKYDASFHKNIDHIRDWLTSEESRPRQASDAFLLDLIRVMIGVEPEHRPSVYTVKEHLELIYGLEFTIDNPRFSLCYFHTCCAPNDAEKDLITDQELNEYGPTDQITVEIDIELFHEEEGTYRQAPNTVLWTIYPPFVVEEIQFFLVSRFEK